MSTPSGRARRADVQNLFDTLQKDVVAQARSLTNSVGMKLVLIPAGTFKVGSSPDQVGVRQNEMPLHEVILTQPFYLGSTPVTQAQYRAVMAENPARFQPAAGGGPDHPVERVSWLDAMAYCKALSQRPEEKIAQRQYRLPTEAEWEYACRAGGATLYTQGEALSSQQANIDGRGLKETVEATGYLERTSKVGSFPANNFGLFDVHGNVWEWCADWYGEAYYAVSETRDPQGPLEGRFRVVRGGCWRSQAGSSRSAYRNALLPHNRDPYTGFRVVCQVITPKDERRGL